MSRSEADGHYTDDAYYDHVYARYRPDLNFYAEVAEEYGGPVLELGVGTGRVAAFLARRGVEVVGVDRMPNMLSRARARFEKLPRRVRDRIEVYLGDMRSFRLDRRFRLVIAPFNAFQHLYDRSDVEAALASCRLHLESTGALAFDVLLPEPHSLSRDPHRFYKCRPISHPRDGQRYEYAEAFAYDAQRQVLTTTMRFSRNGPPRVEFRDTLVQRQFFPQEMEALLHYNGFAVVRHDGGFQREDLCEYSESQVVVARQRSST